MRDGHQRSISTRACDHCRRRKTRVSRSRHCIHGDCHLHGETGLLTMDMTMRQCDGVTPTCGRCATARLDCTWQLPVGKRGPRRKDPAVSCPRPPRPPPPAGPPSVDAPPVDASPGESLASARTGLSDSSALEHAVDEVWRNMLERLRVRLGDRDVRRFFADCIDAYMRHLFPITPIIHEASIRGSLAELLGDVDVSLDAIGPTPAPSINALAVSNGFLPAERSLNLLVALSAQVCSLLPESIFSSDPSVRDDLFRASEQMLRLYHDRDVEHPCAASITIRYFHSSCFHAAGKTRVSWLVLGEAIRLALEMQIFDESSLLGLSMMERQLRRAIFWQLSAGDKSSSILNCRPLCFQNLNFEVPPSTMLVLETPLRDARSTCNGAGYEHGLWQGFGLTASLFDAVTDVLTNLKCLQHTAAARTNSSELTNGLRKVVREDLLRFQCVLDDLPECLECPWRWTAAELSIADLEYQRHGFGVQHVNLKLTFCAMKLILLQKAADFGLADALGFSNDAVLLALQKIEIASEVVACLRRAPFDAIRLNGESCVSSACSTAGGTLHF